MPDYEDDNHWENDYESHSDSFGYRNAVLKNNENKMFVETNKNGDDVFIYSSKGQGNYIHNACHGFTTPYKVGSSREGLFFSVIDSTGYNKSKDPKVYYFDSPEQFERIMNQRLLNDVSPVVKEQWNKNFLKTKTNLIKYEEEYGWKQRRR